MLLRSALFTPEHYERMGVALWIFGRLVQMQTRSNGLVLGGMPLTHAELSKRTGGFHEKFIQRSLATLKSEGYIEVTYLYFHKMRIRILNQKKFGRQQTLPFPVKNDSDTCVRVQAKRPDKCVRVQDKSVRVKQTLEFDVRGTPIKPDSRGNTALAPLAPLSNRADRLSFESKAFEIFWQQYPLQTFRGRAWNEFHVQHCAGDLADILIGLQKWKDSGAFDDPAMSYFAHNFLRQQIWKETPRPRQETRSVKRGRNNATALQKVLGRYSTGRPRPGGRELPN